MPALLPLSLVDNGGHLEQTFSEHVDCALHLLFLELLLCHFGKNEMEFSAFFKVICALHVFCGDISEFHFRKILICQKII